MGRWRCEKSSCLASEPYISSLGVALSKNAHEYTVCSLARLIHFVPREGCELQESQGSWRRDLKATLKVNLGSCVIAKSVNVTWEGCSHEALAPSSIL